MAEGNISSSGMVYRGLFWNSLRKLFLAIVLHQSFSFCERISQPQVFFGQQLMSYKFYKDVQIFHYYIPSKVVLATWNFTAKEIRGCPKRQVAIYLQPGSYPVINPDNSTYPEKYYTQRTSLHQLTMYSNSKYELLNVSVPLPGDWFSVAFLLQKDDRILPKGIQSLCPTVLSATVKFVIEEDIAELVNQITRHQMQPLIPKYFRFYSSWSAWSVDILVSNCSINFTAANNETGCPLLISSRSQALPNLDQEFPKFCMLNSSTEQCILTVYPQRDAWHNIVILSSVNATLEYDIKIDAHDCPFAHVNWSFKTMEQKASSPPLDPFSRRFSLTKAKAYRWQNVSSGEPLVKRDAQELLDEETGDARCYPIIPLVKMVHPVNFMYEFNNYDPKTGEYSQKIMLNPLRISLYSFDLQPLSDIGGTLILQVEIDHKDVNTTNYNISIVACFKKNLLMPFTNSTDCLGDIQLNANTSNADGYWDERRYLPFPEPGHWYVSLRTFCYLGSNQSVMQIIPCTHNDTPVYLYVQSTNCVHHICSKYGQCYEYISGTYVFSACDCTAGWRGWGCTDGSRAMSDSQLLMNILLLTLSNLMFIPAILVALYRRYFTEAFVYFATMFFSSFYHACDEDVFFYCIMHYRVLSFCDFYASILSFWVTLIAMANLNTTLKSLAHMVGAVCLALGVEYDRTGIWVFVAPVGMGILVLSIAWLRQCRKQKSCYPNKKRWMFCLLPGLILAAVGLLLFGFFETVDNYKYTHSVWHILMALSIVFLLPPRKTPSERSQDALHDDTGEFKSFKLLVDGDIDNL